MSLRTCDRISGINFLWIQVSAKNGQATREGPLRFNHNVVGGRLATELPIRARLALLMQGKASAYTARVKRDHSMGRTTSTVPHDFMFGITLV
jgi:hypothetical protein